MRTELLKKHELFVNNARKLIEVEIEPHVDNWEKHENFPNDVFLELGRQGYLGILIPEDLGGIGGDAEMAAAWCDTFGEVRSLGMVTGVNMHSLVITPAIAKRGTVAAKERWIEDAISGKAIGAYAFTEPGAGSDLAQLATKATKSSEGWRLNGSKIFITNGARADFVLVLARTDPAAGYRGFSTFIVDTSLPGFTVRRTLSKLGWHASDTAEISFDDVLVPHWAILGEEGSGWIQASENLSWERIMLTLTSVAGARACLRSTANYCTERMAFGSPLYKIAGVADLLSGMFSRYWAGEALAFFALERYLAQDPAIRAIAAAAKRQVCEDAIWLADKAIQLYGGYGYTTEFPVERWWRDLRLMTIGGGTSEIMGALIAKEWGLQCVP